MTSSEVRAISNVTNVLAKMRSMDSKDFHELAGAFIRFTMDLDENDKLREVATRYGFTSAEVKIGIPFFF